MPEIVLLQSTAREVMHWQSCEETQSFALWKLKTEEHTSSKLIKVLCQFYQGGYNLNQ